MNNRYNFDGNVTGTTMGFVEPLGELVQLTGERLTLSCKTELVPVAGRKLPPSGRVFIGGASMNACSFVPRSGAGANEAIQGKRAVKGNVRRVGRIDCLIIPITCSTINAVQVGCSPHMPLTTICPD